MGTASERQSFHCLEDLDKHICIYICIYIQISGILTVDFFQLSPSTCPLLSHFLFLAGGSQTQKAATTTKRKNLGSEPRMCQINADTMKNNQDMPLWLLMQLWLWLKLTDAKADCQISSVCANADKPARCLAAGLAPTPVALLYIDCLLNNNKMFI